MNILILEDRGSVSYYMQEALELRGYSVMSAGTIWEAQRYWDQRNERPVHCIIIDLNMSAEGLSAEELACTGEGILTGWIWLKERVYRDNPDMKHQTIIYSEYLEDLQRHLADHASEWDTICKVPKRGTTGTGVDVLRCVERIAKSLEGGKP